MKLRDCPFCGQPATVFEATKPGDVGRVWYAACNSCQIGTARCYSKHEAVTMWNRRTANRHLQEPS
jgi:Lar family restriction alleviation protein